MRGASPATEDGPRAGPRNGPARGSDGPRTPRSARPIDPRAVYPGAVDPRAGNPRPAAVTVRPRRPRAEDEFVTTSRREAEAFDASRGDGADRRHHIPGGRLPKVPASAPRALARPARNGRPSRAEPAPFSDFPADAPKGGRRAARGAARARAEAETTPARARANVPVPPQRIAKLLARAGIGSRRDIERMIAEGRITLNGAPLETPATVVASLDGIIVDGQPVAALEPSRLFRFHKPAGFLTTAKDPGGRPTIMDILPPGLPRVVPVGRLDMNTEGLLLLTTDGALKRALELPSSGVPRTYRVRAYGEISQPAVESLIEGIAIDGMHYGPIDAEIERRTGRNLWLTMTLTEGKNREIRRVLEFLGLQVSRLIRVRYGDIELGDLPPRDADEVPDGVVASLRKSLQRS